ncbi:MAG: response regulator, partial [Odoribacter sp.]|nr:response regulator [Odoribacter sp.]
MKILLVEDDPALREILQRSLKQERYIVEIAPDYHTASQKINDYTYDCILLDIMLPDGNGLSILQELKQLKKQENVIILSAKDSIDDKVKGLDLGAAAELPQPFHLAELHAR